MVCLVLLLAGGGTLAAADARSAYLAGVAAQGTEDFELAVEKYKEALSLNPVYLEPMVGLAQSFLQLEEYDEALTFVTKARALRQEQPRSRRPGRPHPDRAGRCAGRPGSLHRGARPAAEQRGGAARHGRGGNRGGKAARTPSASTRRPSSSPRKARRRCFPSPCSTTSPGIAASAGTYYELALKSHASDPRVQLAAASWYASTGNLSMAEKHAQIALSLKPGLGPGADPARGHLSADGAICRRNRHAAGRR